MSENSEAAALASMADKSLADESAGLASRSRCVVGVHSHGGGGCTVASDSVHLVGGAGEPHKFELEPGAATCDDSNEANKDLDPSAGLSRQPPRQTQHAVT